MSARSSLPARDIAQARLAEIVEDGRCPLCLVAQRAERRFLEVVVAERVSDTALHEELASGGGFCPVHTRRLLGTNRRVTGGTVGSAILFGMALGSRLEALTDHARKRRGPGRRRAASAAVACPACAQRDEALRDAADGLWDLRAEPAWADALGASSWCIDHLAAMSERAGGDPAWAAIEQRAVQGLLELRERLASLVHHSSADRRHLLTEAEERAADDAAKRLAGEDPAPD